MFCFSRCALVILFGLSSVTTVQADWNDLLKQGEKILQSSSPSQQTTASTDLDSMTVANGLKEALKVGGERAIDQLSATGGFANNKDVRIPMPGMLETAGGMMRRFGLDAQVDAFEASMNSAAEQAISEATPIFVGTLEEMTLEDAKKIYSGGDSAATEYFRERTSAPLAEKLQPLIDDAMASAGVIQAYSLLVGEAEKVVPTLSGMSPDLGGHVTQGALDGLFIRLAQEEKRIREEPIARSTDLLKQVFGS